MTWLGARAASCTVAALLALAGCTGGSAPVGSTDQAPASAAVPLDVPLVDATTRRPIEGDQKAALDRLAGGASAGTLLARSTDDRVCVFANGRNGWNRAAC